MTSPHSLVERGPDRPAHLVHATGTHCCATPSAQLEHADVETFKVLGPQGVKPVAADAWDQVHVNRRAVALIGALLHKWPREVFEPMCQPRLDSPVLLDLLSQSVIAGSLPFGHLLRYDRLALRRHVPSIFAPLVGQARRHPPMPQTISAFYKSSNARWVDGAALSC